MLKLYDTLAGKLVDFSPRKKGRISIYACGPTVYDVPHLGHARTAITYDVITRYLEWLGEKVTLVVNITDIDDKIIACARETDTTEPELAEKYLDVYLRLMERLNIRPPDFQPRATEYIDQMQEFIARLMDKGAAYLIEGLGIYFDVSAFPEYGSLVHRTSDELAESGQGRIEAEGQKKNQLDFALWKVAKEGEPSWEWKSGGGADSLPPLPAGRPGWHIECVAMSLGELGEGFDIHGGGSDLIFPHHENERAEALAGGAEFARYWVHSGMVNVAGQKMAKSEGNFITLEKQLDEVESRAFRLAVLQTHYRSEMEISETTLKAATAGLERLQDFTISSAIKGVVAAKKPAGADREKFIEHMNNDFATPSALGMIFDLATKGAKALEDISKESLKTAAECLAGVLEFSAALGLDLPAPVLVSSPRNIESKASPKDKQTQEGKQGERGKRKEKEKTRKARKTEKVKKAQTRKTQTKTRGNSYALEPEVQEMISQRNLARENRDFQKSDEIRDSLAAEGISVRDTPKGSYYFLNS